MIRVLIVGDIRLYRDGVAELLRRDAQVDVVGTAAHPDDAIRQISILHPQVVLIDLAMPDSMATVRKIVAGDGDLKVVALGVPEVERDVVACAEAGAVGYVPREGSLEDLTSTVRAVVHGELRCSPRIAATLLRRVAALAAEHGLPSDSPHLTPRELEILALVDQGMSNKQIAQQLGIEIATAKNHVHHILEKLQVHRRGEAAAKVRSRLPRSRRHRSADVT